MLVVAAAWSIASSVRSTRQAEKSSSCASEIRKDATPSRHCAAEWAKLDNPRRIQALTQRHLKDLKPVAAMQFDNFRPAAGAPAVAGAAGTTDPIGAIIESIAAPEARRADTIRDLLDDNTDMRPETMSGSRRLMRRPISQPAASRLPSRRTGNEHRRVHDVNNRAGRAVARRCCARCSTASNVDRDAKRERASAWPFWLCAGVCASSRSRLVHVCGDAGEPCRASHQAHDATATARPDIVDRNGQNSRRPTSARRRCSASRGASSMSTRRSNCSAPLCRTSKPAEARERLSSKRGFVWLSAKSRRRSKRDHRQGIPGIGFLAENKRVCPNGPIVSHLLGHVNIDNQGIAGIERWLDAQRSRRSAHGRFRHRPAAKAGRTRGRPAGAARVARRARGGARQVQGDRRRRHRGRCAQRRRSSRWCRSRITIRTIRKKRSIRRGSTG